jgi:TPR repeat protein
MRHKSATIFATLILVATPGHTAEVLTEAVVARAQSGDAAAQHIVALSFLDKNRHSAEAFDWLLVASQNGYPEAQYRLALRLMDSRKENEDDTYGCNSDSFCLSKCSLPFATYESPSISKERPCVLHQAGQDEEYWLTQAATQGHMNSQMWLAEMYDDDASVLDGYSPSLFLRLSRDRNLTQGMMQDSQKAYHWYSVAAAAGNVEAMEKVGLMAYHGVGTIQDYEHAVQQIARAAIAGNANSQIRLAAIYEKGIVVPSSAVLAYAWANVAAAGGKTAIMKERDRIASSLSMEQITKGQAISRQWVTGQSMAE